jgi:hypothetical protein
MSAIEFLLSTPNPQFLFRGFRRKRTQPSIIQAGPSAGGRPEGHAQGEIEMSKKKLMNLKKQEIDNTITHCLSL